MKLDGFDVTKLDLPGCWMLLVTYDELPMSRQSKYMVENRAHLNCTASGIRCSTLAKIENGPEAPRPISLSYPKSDKLPEAVQSDVVRVPVTLAKAVRAEVARVEADAAGYEIPSQRMSEVMNRHWKRLVIKTPIGAIQR